MEGEFCELRLEGVLRSSAHEKGRGLKIKSPASPGAAVPYWRGVPMSAQSTDTWIVSGVASFFQLTV